MDEGQFPSISGGTGDNCQNPAIVRPDPAPDIGLRLLPEAEFFFLLAICAGTGDG